MLNKINGTLEKIYMRDETTGYSVFGLKTEEIDVKRNADGLVLCKGIIPKWPEETNLITKGHWEDGCYLLKKAKPYTETIEISKKLLKKIVKELTEEDESFKLSPVGIKKIVGVSGADILSFMKEKDSLDHLITMLPKIRKETLEAIHKRMLGISESYQIIDYLCEFGGTASNCDKLIQLYGSYALGRLKKHPYCIGYSAGIDFFTCDRIAKSLRFDALNDERISSIAYEALDQILIKSGSTYATQSQLKKQVMRICKKSAYPEETIPSALLAANIQKMNGLVVEIMRNGARIYKKYLYECEYIIANNLKRLNMMNPCSTYDEKFIDEVQNFLKIKYSEKQKEAFSVLKTNGVKIITGGPGTGKTTIVNGILYMYKKMHPGHKIVLCAPTGRASQRMSEVTLMDASTIHRTLDFRPFENGKVRHKDAENPIDCNLLILDEMSMVDTEIFAKLLSAIPKGCTVILIGDENQLQSVSPGNVLHDLIISNQFEMYRLKEVFRQKGKPTIIENAYKILEGRMDLEKDDTFEIFFHETIKDAVDCTIKLFDEAYQSGNLNNCHILSPVRIGDGGTRIINKTVSEMINKKANTEEELTFCHKKTVYHLNDKVIFEKNNYEKDYYNGDIGYITGIMKNGLLVSVCGDVKRITGENLNDLSLAFAITIHKSQGSEADTIIIILPDTYSYMLNRNMLFTAITRAVKHVKIVYVNSALSDSIHTIHVNKRNTGLVDKLTGVKREVLK